jgi:hypothetical protein
MKLLLLTGMAVFLKNTTFHGILLDALFESTSEDKKEVVRLLNEGIKSGAVRPLPATVFSETQVEQAFRYRFLMISTVYKPNNFIVIILLCFMYENYLLHRNFQLSLVNLLLIPTKLLVLYNIFITGKIARIANQFHGAESFNS